MRGNITAGRLTYLICTLAGVCLSLLAKADIRLPAVISNNMVLQQQSQVKLWGWAEAGEKIMITTSWDNQTYPAVTTTRDARWMLPVKTPKAGGPFTITFKGKNSITLSNILIGEVWVCSGQSNMEMNGNWGLKDIKDERPMAYNNQIRFFNIPKITSRHPQDDCKANWTVCDSNTIMSFSAVAYFFGKKLNKDLNVPIGLVSASWGGTTAEVWTPDSIVNNDAVLKAAAAKIEPSGMCPYLPGYAYNAMIAPITNYNIAGTIWYQGENNTGTATTYKQLFTAMIDSWRNAWGAQFPFYYVQVAPFKYALKNTGALMREAQLQSMVTPNTGMVVTTDIAPDVYNVHPANKHDVGLRLANWAMAETYHRTGITYKTPVFKTISIKNDKAEILIDNAPKGLMMKGDSINELLIAGNDKVFYPAKAKIKNNRITVWSSLVPQPVAVRFGFSNTAIGNLFNKEGLPVSPFRTDDWPVETK